MLDIAYLIQALDKTILEQKISSRTLKDYQGIILLKNQSKLLGNYIYVGTYSAGMRFLKHCPPEPALTFFLSAEDANQTNITNSCSHNVIISALDIFDIYNRINIVLSNYRCWAHTLMEARCAGKNLNEILEIASGMIQSQIYILNPGYKIIAKNGTVYFRDALSQELEEYGYLTFETSLKLNKADRASSAAYHFSNSKTAVSSSDICYQKLYLAHVTYHICRITRDGKTLAFALLPENPATLNIDLKHLLEDLSDIIADSLFDKQKHLTEQNLLFTTFLDDIVEERLTDQSEIQNRSSFLTYPLKDFCSFIVVQFDVSHVSYHCILQQLQTIFPKTNMVFYQENIVILYSQENRPQGKLDFDYDKLAAILEKCNGYAGISHPSRHRARFRTLYLLATAAIRIGKTLHRKTLSKRLFLYEDYSMYYIIDLCAQKYIETHHHNDLIYLIHPSIMKICRYDAEHHTNLRDILYYYLLCGCNLGRTAQTMYMHRNTVLNKLNKINEIAEIPLEDGYTQQRMIISCLIVRYYEEYLNMTIRL